MKLFVEGIIRSSFSNLKNQIVFIILHKNICCGYSFEVLNEALLMGTHNICFGGE